MKSLVIESWLWLLLCDVLMTCAGIAGLYRLLEVRWQSHIERPADPLLIDALVHAAELACVFYFRDVKCLQRSSTTTVLLRRHGVNAQMILAAQLIPLRNHAWVECDGRIVNDKPYMHEIYQVIERR
jgi:hypothetical protein